MTVDQDRAAIREVIENWALWRDAGDWDRFATVWHEDAWMTATWFQGPARRFIEVSREGFDRGVSILHFLGGFTCDVAAHRAIAQTKMTINQRASVDGVLVDVVCTGRFYDFLEQHGVTIPAELRERDVTLPAIPNETVEEGILRLYKTQPDLEILFELMTDFDEGFQEWRYRHIKLVERTIGSKRGTGGSLGVEFLKQSLFKPLFPDLWAIRHKL